jgi:multiple sugar transport system permease protein
VASAGVVALHTRQSEEAAALWRVRSVTGVFLLGQHFFLNPSDLEDAARVDGAGRFRTFWQACLPLVTNSLTALAIFTVPGLWNDLFWPLIVLTEQSKLTLPIGLLVLQQGSYIQRGLAYAGAFVATVPILVFCTISLRRIIAGITMTGMAGQWQQCTAARLTIFQPQIIEGMATAGFVGC